MDRRPTLAPSLVLWLGLATLFGGPANAADTAPSGTNLVLNPGFEAGITEWTSFGGSGVLSPTTTAHAGAGAALSTQRTQFYNGPSQNILGRLNAGTTYVISAWARLASVPATSQPLVLNIKQVDGSGTKYLEIARFNVTDTGWHKLKGWFTYNPNGAVSGLTLYLQGPAAQYDLYVDEVAISPPLAYSPPAASPTDFVRAKGRNLVVGANEQVIRLLGTNFAAYTDNESETVDNLLKYQYFDPDTDYHAVKAMGMNVVRLNLWWKFFEDPANPYTYLPSGWQWLERNLVRAREAGVYVILDLHAPQCGYQSPTYTGRFWGAAPDCRDRAKALWVQIASRYKNDPTIAAFDLINEPNPPTNQQWVEYAGALTAAIRAADPNHLIDIEQSFADDSTNFLVADANVIYDFHNYNPWDWTAQLSYFSGYGNTNRSYPDPEAPVFPWDWNYGVLVENASIPKGTTGWTWYEGTPVTAPSDATLFGAVPVLASGVNAGTIYYDDFAIDEYDLQGAFVRRVTSVDIEARPSDWYLLRDYDPFLSFTESWSLIKQSGSATQATQTDAHRGARSLSLAAVTGKAYLRSPNLKFAVKPGHRYKLSGWMKGVGVTDQSGGLGLQWLHYKPWDAFRPLTQATLEQMMRDEAVAFYRNHNKPVNIGEFGVSYNNFEAGRGGDRWVADNLALMRQYGLSGQYWGWRDSVFGITHEPTGYPDPARANQTLVELLQAGYARVAPRVYEDAENGAIGRWRISDASPAGALIENLFDDERGSRVIRLDGSQLDNAFDLRKADGSELANRTQFIARWWQRSSVNHRLEWVVKGASGATYRLRYLPKDGARCTAVATNPQLIDCPMGLASRNGAWQQKVRNLASDLAQAKPGETPAVVRYLTIRGSGRFDDIQLGIQ